MKLNAEQFLTEGEIQRLRSFWTDESMRDAVKKVMLSGIYEHGTLIKGKKLKDDLHGKNFIIGMVNTVKKSNEILGQDVKAAVMAMTLLEAAFLEIESLAVQQERAISVNPAI